MKDIIGSKIILCFYIIVTTTERQESEASPLQNQPAVEVEVAGVNQGVVQTSEMEVEGEDVAGGVKNSVEVTPKDTPAQAGEVWGSDTPAKRMCMGYPDSPRDQPLSPRDHPDSLRDDPDSPKDHPDSLKDHPNSPRDHPGP